ncbi:DUF58 domain-containing protein [Alloiococcus sp. CFN-8]|uniref:DUF58 domain-containing protein n=1 Tax=Alloiococcus sp. CFN-8 TaxID=3416081 RepID=UPI003CFB95E2
MMIKLNLRYMLLIFISFIVSLSLGGILVNRIFYMLLTLLGIAVLLSLFFIFSIKIGARTDDKQYFAGDKAELIITVENKYIFYIPYIIFMMPVLSKFIKEYNGELVSLSSKEELYIRCKLSLKTRGAYPLEEVIIWTRDPLGIINLRRKRVLEEILKVYPKRYAINEKLITQEEAFQSLIHDPRTLEDPYSSRDLRKYRVGDNLKRVNWKVTAKKNEVFIRNYDHVTGDEFSIFLDMHRDNNYIDAEGRAEELMVDFALSLGAYFVDKAIKTTIHMNKLHRKSSTLNNQREVVELVEYMIKEKSDGKSDFKSFVTENIHKLKSKGAVALITYKATEEIREALIALKEQGYRPVLFIALKEEDYEAMKQPLERLGISIYIINDVIRNEEL